MSPLLLRGPGGSIGPYAGNRYFFFFLYKNLFFDDTIHIMYKMILSIQAIFKLDQSVQSLILMLGHVP